MVIEENIVQLQFKYVIDKNYKILWQLHSSTRERVMLSKAVTHDTLTTRRIQLPVRKGSKRPVSRKVTEQFTASVQLLIITTNTS